jgi:hypothetical protein
MTTKVLEDGSIAFEKGALYVRTRQVYTRNETETNFSNNVGYWVVLSSNVQGIGNEASHLSVLLTGLKNAKNPPQAKKRLTRT